MSFIIDQTVLYIKLTNAGRDLLSRGELKFNKFAIGDSEIDYNFIRNNPNVDPDDASVLRPNDNEPRVTSFILRSPSAETLNTIEQPVNTILTLKSKNIESKGIFNNNNEFNSDEQHVKEANVTVDNATVNGGKQLILNTGATYIVGRPKPVEGDYLFIRWSNPDYTGNLNDNLEGGNSIIQLTYKIISIINGDLDDGSLEVIVDRNLPNFNGDTGSSRVLIYPNNNDRDTLGDSIQTYYGAPFVSDFVSEQVLTFQENFTRPTIEVPVWNMSIVHSREIAGVQKGYEKFSQLPTRGFVGFVNYIERLEPIVENIGIIHYTNLSPAHDYGEELFYLEDDSEKLPRLTIPHVMWYNNTLSGDTLELTSKYSSLDEYPDLNIPYFDLVDNGEEEMVVGKVFPTLKIFVIEDQELLAALTYKSNRNWTLPPASVAFNLEPCAPVTITTTDEV